jgi:hypothetical protein
MTKRRRKRQQYQLRRPCEDLKLDLTIEEIITELDAGWSAKPDSPDHQAEKQAA